MVRWTLGLFYVPTVVFKLEHSQDTSVHRAVQQVYLASTGRSHPLHNRNVEPSKLDPRRLLDAASGATMK